jgi:hypothetical protein
VPRLIETDVAETCTLDELIDALEASDFDARDEDNFASWGPMLKRLGNNRSFLADRMIAALKSHCEDQVRDNQYSAQVVMLYARSTRFSLRANIWPALTDSIIRHSGTDPFFYGTAHDHNFSFLTVGYLGPGYWSDYYEYDYGEVVGYPGEKVDLRFIGKSKLDLGKVMLYRAHLDVHNQLPADALSVSLNIMEASHSAVFRDQYRFDLASSTIDGFLTRVAVEPMLAVAAHHGGANGADLLAEFAARHPSERMRWAATHARAGAADGLDARIAALEEAARGSSALVSGLARHEIAKLEAGRTWIETAPTVAA